jgi:putative ABC transport system ATP-binding protein
VAIARALAASPQLLLADEPTGQLDSETAKQIMRLLHAVVESEGVTALVATHDPNLIGIADSVLELEDGQIKGNLSERSAVPASGRCFEARARRTTSLHAPPLRRQGCRWWR